MILSDFTELRQKFIRSKIAYTEKFIRNKMALSLS